MFNTNFFKHSESSSLIMLSTFTLMLSVFIYSCEKGEPEILPLSSFKISETENGIEDFQNNFTPGSYSWGDFVCQQTQIIDNIQNNPIWLNDEEVEKFDRFMDRMLSTNFDLSNSSDQDSLLMIMGMTGNEFNQFVTTTKIIMNHLIQNGVIGINESAGLEVTGSNLFDALIIGECGSPLNDYTIDNLTQVECCNVAKDADYDLACIQHVCADLDECIESAYLNAFYIFGTLTAIGGFGGPAGTALGLSAGAVYGATYLGWKISNCNKVARMTCNNCVHIQ